jgi:hypothetical protein
MIININRTKHVNGLLNMIEILVVGSHQSGSRALLILLCTMLYPHNVASLYKHVKNIM